MRHVPTRRRAAFVLPALAALSTPLAPVALGQSSEAPAATAVTADGPTLPVGAIELVYFTEVEGQPALSELADVPVTLGRTDSGLTAPRAGIPTVVRTVGDLALGGVDTFHTSGLQTVLVALRDALADRDLFAIYVVQDQAQITETGVDLRGGSTDLRIIVVTSTPERVRTVARGERTGEDGDIAVDEAINNPLHARIIENSPVQAGGNSVISRSALDDYVYFLGRHPGRRVDLAIAPGEEVGTVSLDYEITENRPLLMYAETSNTGTASTDHWRQRFGLVHSQLTDSDDVLSLDYTTAFFDDVHAVTASYARPLSADGRTRASVFGVYSRYDAEDVGVFAQDFTGENFSFSAEVSRNVYQDRELFVDVFAGLRYDDVSVEQTLFNLVLEDSAQYLTPYIGARLDRTTDWYSTRAQATLEWQADLLGNDATDIDGLGRTSPDEDWVLFRLAGSHSTYLEPLLNREAWEDPSTPESSTLAHELRFRTSAQWAFGQRLIPQSQIVAGGLTSVRGYPQSVVASDSALLVSAEYRFHVARAQSPEAEVGELFGQPFRFAPQFVYGVPDWDLVLKGFVDGGLTDNSDALFFESGEELLSAGIGLEFQYRRNINVNLDWGFALSDLDQRNVDSGDDRLHLKATFLF